MNFSATFIISRLRVTENYGKIPINKVNFLLLLVVQRDKNERKKFSFSSFRPTHCLSLLPSSYFPATSVYIQLHCFEDISLFTFLFSFRCELRENRKYIWRIGKKLNWARGVEYWWWRCWWNLDFNDNFKWFFLNLI